MSIENEWEAIRGNRGGYARNGGMGLLRVTLLFGSGAVALALLLAPIAAERSRGMAAASRSLDPISTGSVGPKREIYTLRRSVLQKNPNAVCIIEASGARSGDC